MPFYENEFHLYNKSNQMFLIHFSIHFQQVFWFIWSNVPAKAWQFSIEICFVTKFARGNLALKTPATEVLNSGVVIYLSWLWLLSLFSISVFLTRLLTLGILFSTVVNAVFVAKSLTLGILPSISEILVL